MSLATSKYAYALMISSSWNYKVLSDIFVKMELFTYSYSYFGPFFRKQKGFYLQKSMKCKNFESQYRKIAQNADRTL